MDPREMVKEIEKLKKERNAVILAHNYQIGEVQDIADYVGDSLELSRIAAKTSADVIVFCGVHFMAETASILSPQKTVLMPDRYAGCPMAEMIDAGDVRELRAANPSSEVVCYVNTSAAVKAESDICCTSANVVDIIDSRPEGAPPICVPDMHLASFAHQKTGKALIPWEGYCHVHAGITAAAVREQKTRHPDAKIVVHPECPKEVLELADEVLSTSGMCRFAKKTDAREMIIGTEIGILHKLRKENPGKHFYPAWDRAICDNMKKTTLEKVCLSLRHMQYEVRVPDEIRQKALRAVNRMIENREGTAAQ